MKHDEFLEIINSLESLPELTLWISSDYMTEEEKKSNPNHMATGGYLKTLDYKDAHRIWWSKLSKEDKAKITGLPNFDAAQFEQITGINISKASDSDKKIELVKAKMAQLEQEMAELKKELEK